MHSENIWPSNHQVIETNRDVMPVTDTRTGIVKEEQYSALIGRLCNAFVVPYFRST